MFPQVLDGLGFSRASQTPQMAAAMRVHGRGHRDVTSVGQRRDHQTSGVARVLVAVRLFAVGLSDSHVVRFSVPIESQLTRPFERARVRTV